MSSSSSSFADSASSTPEPLAARLARLERERLAADRAYNDALTALDRAMGHGQGYKYPHDHGGYVAEHYLPERLRGTVFYAPKGAGYEQQIAQRLERWRQLRDSAD